MIYCTNARLSWKRAWAATVLAPLIIAALTGTALAENQTVRIGTEADFAPFEFKDASGALKGLEIELAAVYCARAHLNCTFVNMDFDGLIPALQSHLIDAAMSQMSVTNERKNSVTFTTPVTHSDVRLIAAKDSTITDDLSTLKGKTIAVESGGIEEHWANAHLKGVAGDIKAYQGQDQAFEDLKSGRADVVITDEPVGYDWLQKDGKDGYRFVGKPLDDVAILGTGDTAIAVRLDDAALAGAFNAAIKDARDNGAFAAITAKYFPFSLAPKL